MTKKNAPSPLEDQIAENLRRVYRQRQEEEVPDRFLDLLRMLKDQDQGGETRDADR